MYIARTRLRPAFTYENAIFLIQNRLSIRPRVAMRPEFTSNERRKDMQQAVNSTQLELQRFNSALAQ